jgi:DNA mismatch repair protein MutS2
MTDPTPIPDLLSVEPLVRIDVDELHQHLVFGFAVGTSTEAFDRVLARATLPASGWDRTGFERDLFLQELVTRALRVRLGGRPVAPCVPYLLRAVAEPPRDPAVVTFRQAVLAELRGTPALRADLERVYGGLVALRAQLCSERVSRRGGGTHRRLEILRALQQVIDDLAGGFEGARSGLSRLSAFGKATQATKAYERLAALLDHDRHMGTLDLRVRVGADGMLSTFQIVAVRENSDNPFHRSPFLRFLSRLRLLLLGYRVGPGEVAERLLDDVFGDLERHVCLLFQLIGDMEFYLAGLGLADLADERGLPVCLPEIVRAEPSSPEGGIEAVRLYNPLLLAGKTSPVPCDLRTGHGDGVVIVTGPNSGGKTRLLQAVGLLQLLGQAGLFVTAERARIRSMSGMFVSLIEEARADQPEGQLGMELLRIRRLFEELGLGSLVLIDELCSGTNPSEGEEIARLVISLLPELQSQVFVTTHLLTLASHLEEEPPIPRMQFLQVELDATERPTYAFVPGVAKTSLAHRTAARLGVTRDELLGLVAAKKRARAAGQSDVPARSEGKRSSRSGVERGRKARERA